MKRSLLLGVLLLGAGLALAAGNNEIRCVILGGGSGKSISTSDRVRYFVGPAVVGRSTSATYQLTHGPVPCQVDALTAVADEPGAVPRVLQLMQNAPNPFNPRTTIEFALPRDADHVLLAVYDVSGRLVRTLIDGPEPAGTRSVTWNGRDDAGRTTASGVYFYRLDTPQGRITKKMTLLK